jgi:hypothetical protein
MRTGFLLLLLADINRTKRKEEEDEHHIIAKIKKLRSKNVYVQQLKEK